ncbi:alpha-(1,3)-fucosyltransferase C [Aplysia californica]|uniref:Fucosyltransferase n=1 Tax=Aplysia californica TaxID=6500 RepID=A0ABM0ZZ27_APLCA|nr:alpha-(1,3)-fucosyltransferase C [Aplysia californica]
MSEKSLRQIASALVRPQRRAETCGPQKRPALLEESVILRHDNAPVHKSRVVHELLDGYSWEFLVLEHPPYSPDLASCSFHLFPKKYVDVDIFGACGKACPKTPDWCGRDMGQYHFYLAFENSLCADYVTEKFFKIFRKDFPVVPVVRGGADYDQLFPPRTFVNAASFKSAKELALHLKKLRGNAEEYGELLWEKLQYTKTKHDLNDFHCQLCEYLNSRDPLVRRFYDIRKWMGSCDIPKDIAG